MQVVLVQHGEAVAKDVDPDRPLTERGRRDVEALAIMLGRAEVVPATVWHSGKTRARKTAEALSIGNAPAARDGLGPTDDPAAIAAELEHRADDVMLVGHQPFMGRLASRLLTGRDDGLTVGFEPGTAVCVDRGDDGGWRLGWMIRPALVGHR